MYQFLYQDSVPYKALKNKNLRNLANQQLGAIGMLYDGYPNAEQLKFFYLTRGTDLVRTGNFTTLTEPLAETLIKDLKITSFEQLESYMNNSENSQEVCNIKGIGATKINTIIGALDERYSSSPDSAEIQMRVRIQSWL